MSLFRSPKKELRQTLRVVSFTHNTWGFTDASLAKLRTMLDEFGDTDFTVLHNGVIARFFGDEKKDEFERIRSILERARGQSEFEGFVVGVAEGACESFIDVGKITTNALRNKEKA